MSSEACALRSATFHEPGYDHVMELVHQRDSRSRRSLLSVDVEVRDRSGEMLAARPIDPSQELLDLAALGAAGGPVMVTIEARYDPRTFPYRPHHYAFLHRRGSEAASLYYAVNAVLGGQPARVGTTTVNNLENYLFLRRPFAERHSLLVGNVALWAHARAQVFAWYGSERQAWDVDLDPGQHVEVALPAEGGSVRLERVELKTPFRLASYVVGRRTDTGELVLFDHLFPYFR